MSTIKEFTLKLDELQFVGRNLNRPENLIAEKDGTLWIADARGIVTRMDPAGKQTLLGNIGHEPNGLAMNGEGNLYNANIGTGKIYKVLRDGSHTIILDQIDGKPLGSPNFVLMDRQDRLWISVSTRGKDWFPAVASPRPDGYIILMDKKGPRIVAEGIHFTNEIRMDAEEEYLYAAETMTGHILRFPVSADGSLGNKELVGPLKVELGAYVDGFTFDVEGNIWITTIFRNGVMVLTPDGHCHTVFEDPVESAIKNMVDKIAKGTLAPEDMGPCTGPRLKLPTSLTFGGSDRKTVYVGSLGMDCLIRFQSPVPGLPLRHWS
jgi:gluconolactonase